MSDYYQLDILGLSRNLPIIPISEDLAIASFVILGDTELVVKSALELSKQLPDYDTLMTVEAKGIPLAAEISRLQGKPRFTVCRKSKKLYMKEPLTCEVNSITTGGVQRLYLSEEDSNYIKGLRVVLIDDVISTGGSLEAMEKLAYNAGAKIVARAAILAEGDAIHRSDIIYLEELPLFHL